ncbi:hypothetical protein JXA34_02205 [Patescibacteria group bacterium]|nr:hypothetical protein [Patescibacteria group bacterium]
MSQDTINNRLKIISDLQDEMHKLRTQYTESLESDPEYQVEQEKARKQRSDFKLAKERVVARPTMRSMDMKVRELRDEIKDHKEMLAQELADYYKETGQLKFTDGEGNEKRVIFSAKVVNA